MRILLNMNTSLVIALQGFVDTSKVLFGVSQYHNWNSIGATATKETITTLGELLQRVLQSGPIQGSLSFGFSGLATVSNRKRFTYATGNKYDGQFNENGLRHGFGKYTSKSSTYIGEWEEGKRKGYGKDIFPDQEASPNKTYMTEYEGTFQDDRRHGYGKCIFKDGSGYVGEWDSDRRHGYGKEFYWDGACYEGQWNRGLRHGYGVLSWSRSVKYEGDWVFGKRQGYGTKTWTDGITYEGEFRNGHPHGPGVKTYPDGEKYDGYFFDGQRNGYGKVTKRSGEIVEAMWKNGTMERVLDG
jgi:hypothetical protein